VVNCGCFWECFELVVGESIRHTRKIINLWNGVFNAVGFIIFSSSSHLRIPSFGRTDVGWGRWMYLYIYALSLYILLLLLLLVLAILLLFRLFYSTSLLFIHHGPDGTIASSGGMKCSSYREDADVAG